MKTLTIAVASGKGGTGKTTIVTNLCSVSPVSLAILDCDVEEPNCHLFLKPQWTKSERFTVLIPEVDMEKCTLCGICQRDCRFNAIVIMGKEPLIFPELCHACGVCARNCPENAITEVPREIGTIEVGKYREHTFVHGLLDIGEAKSPPLIEEVRSYSNRNGITMIDAPPGTSCPVVATTRGVDYLVLVTEPTPFGLHDLKLAVGMANQLGLKYGVVINRSNIGDDSIKKYCTGENISILAELPHDRRVAELYSRGEIITDSLPEYEKLYRALFARILKEVEG
ncbi:MAG: ATP-binding protein [Candidatus Eremiobacteraeota bacterium]|nr:ATP-binding protein [Candidatus Eremiobacteraeota bacterium]